MKEFKIRQPEDVGRFFFWLAFDCKLSFHPDDDFEDYMDEDTLVYSFSDDDARYYNYTMRECFDVCEKFNLDIYEIAEKTLMLYNCCIGIGGGD